MPTLIKSNALTFDDVLLVPQYSDIASRQDVDISTELLGIKFATPICSANMDTVTEFEMAAKMSSLGGVGFLHRYVDIETVGIWINSLRQLGAYVIPSIGVRDDEHDIGIEYMNLGAHAINVDIAHGDSEHMVKTVKLLKRNGATVIAGNVSTFSGAKRLLDAGADAIKVGIGPGSMCTTRIVTGHGVPQLSAIEEVAKLKRVHNFGLIADGGIRNSGDCVKALAFGADMVMVGSLLAGCTETPGVYMNNMKIYRGMASREARNNFKKVESTYTPEGESTLVPNKGPVEGIIHQLIGGIRSGMSYSGAHTLSELRANCEYVTITHNGMIESHPHGINR